MSQDVISKTKLFLEKTYNREEIKTVKLSFFGGEPLLRYDDVVVPLIAYVRSLSVATKKNLIIHITTNGFLLNDNRIKQLKELGVTSFQITLDGNESHHNKVRFEKSHPNSYSTILQNLKTIARQGMTVILRINYTKENIDSIHDIINDINDIQPECKKNVIFSLNRVWQDKTGNIDNELDIIEKSIEKADFESFHNFGDGHFQFACYADRHNEAVINFNGDVFKCNARDFKPENAEGILSDSGEIHWNEKYQQRLDCRFKNKPCFTCAMFPLCNGGCRQYVLEHSEKDFCLFDFSEEKKRKFVESVIFSKNVTTNYYKQQIL